MNNLTSPHIATVSGQAEVIKLIIEASTEVDIIESNDNLTVLHFAADRSDVNVVNTLLKSNADIFLAMTLMI